MSAIQKPLLFSGNSNIDLAREIASRMDTRLGSALVDKFKNEECRIEIKENVRGAEVFVLQSICRAPNGNSVNDSLMELLLMIDALSRASAYRITAIVPYYGYAKQDKKTKGREPISAKLVANLIEKAGAKRLVTLDLHAAQIQGFFDLPVDNLVAAPTLCSYLKAQGLEGDKIVVVSPDAGGVPRAENFAKRLRADVAIVFKRRPEPDVSEVTTIVVTCATHGIFAGDAVRVLSESPIERIIVTNTLPNVESALGPKFKVLSIAQIIADAVKRITANRSVSELFTKDEEPPSVPMPSIPDNALTLPEILTRAT